MSIFKRKKNTKPDGAGAPAPGGAPAGRVMPERTQTDKSLPPDPYFSKLTKTARIMRYIVTFVLVFFTISVAVFASDDITAEKLKLLVRNVSLSLPGENVSFTTVRYDADAEMDFASYRDYFAVAVTSGVRLYDHRGNVALNEQIKLASPALDAGDDYLLVYDREGKNYMLCNSVAQLYTGVEDYPICCADVADNGSYMILTSSPTYLCRVKVFNRSFKQTRDIQIDRCPLYAQYADDAGALLLISYTVNAAGKIEGHIGYYDLTGDTKLLFDAVENELPLGGRLTTDGAAVLYADRIVFYDRAGQVKRSESFGQSAPRGYYVGEDVFVIDFEDNAVLRTHRLACFGLGSGAQSKTIDYKGNVTKVFVVNGLLYARGESGMTVYDLVSGSSRTLAGQPPEKVLSGVNGAVFFCDRSKAVNVEELTQLRELAAEREKTDGARQGGQSGAENGQGKENDQ